MLSLNTLLNVIGAPPSQTIYESQANRDLASERVDLGNQQMRMQNASMEQAQALEPVLQDIRARAAQGDQGAMLQLWGVKPEQAAQLYGMVAKMDAAQREALSLQNQGRANQLLAQMESANPQQRETLLRELAPLLTTQEFTKALNPGQDTPASVREYQYYENLPPDQQQRYLSVKRAAPRMDLGSQVVVLGPDNQPAATFQKDLPPASQPENISAQEQARVQGKAKAEWQTKEPILLNNIGSMTDKNAVIDQTIDQTKNLLSGLSAEFGTVFKNLPASEAKRVSNLLDTIKANIGFAALQEMRNNSPTGGALGQVSEMENRLLQAVWGSLDQAGDIGDMIKVLDRIKMQRQATLERLQWAYDQDRNRYGSSLQEGAQAPTMQAPDTTNLYDKYGLERP